MTICKICDDRGWLFSWSDGRETMADGYHIEKCDSCEENGTASFKTDREAIAFFAALNRWPTTTAVELDRKGWKI